MSNIMPVKPGKCDEWVFIILIANFSVCCVCGSIYVYFAVVLLF